MSIYISDSFHAAANVNFTVPGTPAFTSQNGFSGTPADTGVGVTTLTLTDAIDAAAMVVQATPISATFAALTCTITDDTTIVVRAWDAAGAALDNIPFAISILRYATST